MVDDLKKILVDKKILIAGYGIEGISSANFLLDAFEELEFTIADKDPDLAYKHSEIVNNPRIKLITGKDYLRDSADYDLIIKSPGIPVKAFPKSFNQTRITSQTELFIRYFSDQIVGVTGTKGKSTTSSLLYHIIQPYNENAILVGNIGIPPFDLISKINSETVIIFEISSHQLEHVKYSPHISILLNLYQEHLDRYSSYDLYLQAKLNIIKYQSSNDHFIFNDEDEGIEQIVQPDTLKQNIYRFSLTSKPTNSCYALDERKIIYSRDNILKQYDLGDYPLSGNHNLSNILAVIIVSNILNIPDEVVIDGIRSFTGLEHRMEYVGKFRDIHFYNDSIATIPEATIHALETLKTVNTLILGGYDRGINYEGLIRYLKTSTVTNIIFIGGVGRKLIKIMAPKKIIGQNYFLAKDFHEVFQIVLDYTEKEQICLLSPAAASYGMFNNFEERGKIYKKIAKNL